jgi:predicted dehydrogenase
VSGGQTLATTGTLRDRRRTHKNDSIEEQIGMKANRRHFIGIAAGGAAAAAYGTWKYIRGDFSSEIRVAIVGLRGRGKEHIKGFSEQPGCRIVALCDVDSAVLAESVAELKKTTKHEIRQYSDIRKVLEAKDIDVVSVATPNHWHSLMGIWAVQAGKDVYLEKPVSHNVWEGRKLVEAARKYERIVQAGTQCRSARKGLAQAVEWVGAGNLGKITLARGLCYKRRMAVDAPKGGDAAPDTVDYDLWCGPAEKLPVTRKRFHYDWHWFWNTGNGDLGNQGIHQVDICRWFLGEPAMAPSILSIGGRLGYKDAAETANTHLVWQGYEKAPLLFEVRGLETAKYKDADIGCVIHCEGGHILVPNYDTAIAFDKDGKEMKKWDGSEDHFANFVKAVRSRKSSELHADVLEGHISSGLCHTGNISHRLGAKKSPEELKAVVLASPALAEALDRMVEHLKANNVAVETDQLTLGAALAFDPKAETFTGGGADAANALLTRNYRAPFVVPAAV